MLMGDQPLPALLAETLAYAHPAALHFTFVIGAATVEQVMHHSQPITEQKTRLMNLEHGLTTAHFHTGLPMRLIGRAALEAQRADGVVGHHVLGVVTHDLADVLTAAGGGPGVQLLLNLRLCVAHGRTPCV